MTIRSNARTTIVVVLVGMLIECGSEANPDQSAARTIRWRTASEESNFGFDIFRATSKDGPFTKITAKPVPGAGTTDTPQSYSYHDSGIHPDKRYFYYVESISLNGERKRFTPIIEVEPWSDGN